MDRYSVEALHVVSDPVRLRVLAALLEAGDRLEAATVEAVAAQTGIDPARVQRALRQIGDAGFFDQRGEQYTLRVLEDAVAAAVAERPLERALAPGSSIRGLVRRGVLVHVPTRAAQQAELAETLALAVGPFDRVTEGELNRLLADMGPDDAMLRRLLVDFGWLSRDPATQVYRPTERARALWTDRHAA